MIAGSKFTCTVLLNYANDYLGIGKKFTSELCLSDFRVGFGETLGNIAGIPILKDLRLG